LAGVQIVLNGSSSYDNDGEIVNFKWVFGDGSTGSEGIAYHTYASPGTYNVSLLVTDDDGASSSALTSVRVFSPTAIGIRACGPDGGVRNVFGSKETVYASIDSPVPLRCRLYVVSAGKYGPGFPLQDFRGGFLSLNGVENSTVPLWTEPAPGNFDIVLDLEGDGLFDPNTDPVYSSFTVAQRWGALPILFTFLLFLMAKRCPRRAPLLRGIK